MMTAARQQAVGEAVAARTRRQADLQRELKAMQQSAPGGGGGGGGGRGAPLPVAVLQDTAVPRKPSDQAMRARCERELGAHFAPVYAYMRAAHQKEVPAPEMQRELEAMVGRAKLSRCFLVEQLLFLELTSA